MTINEAIDHLKIPNQENEYFKKLLSMNEEIQKLLETPVPKSFKPNENTKPWDYHTLDGFHSNHQDNNCSVVLGEYTISPDGHWLNQAERNSNHMYFSTRLCSLVEGNVNDGHFGRALHNELIISGYCVIDCQEYCLKPRDFRSGTGMGKIRQRLLLGKKYKWIKFFNTLSPNQEVIFVYKSIYYDFRWLVKNIGDVELTDKWNQLNKRCITRELELEVIVEKL